jgi:hypothetical protein
MSTPIEKLHKVASLRGSLYTAYLLFMKLNNNKPINKTMFSRELDVLSSTMKWGLIKTRTKFAWVFQGISVNRSMFEKDVIHGSTVLQDQHIPSAPETSPETEVPGPTMDQADLPEPKAKRPIGRPALLNPQIR